LSYFNVFILILCNCWNGNYYRRYRLFISFII